MHLFISAGEPSGDLHGASLIRALRQRHPDLKLVGFGGDKMQQEGCELLFPLCNLSVMWFVHVILNIATFFRLLKQAKTYFHEQKPDAVIVIDYPGFHWQLAKRAHAEGIPVYYFVPPQLWAWGGWRVGKMKRWFRKALCALPFEEKWYRDRGMPAQYIGHPYFDEIAHQIIDETFVAAQQKKPGRVIAILPGSRTQEVKKNLRIMLGAAAVLHKKFPDTRFLVASFKESQAELARAAVAELNLPIEIFTKKTPEILRLAEACIAVSGSVSIEIMYQRKPTVILYRISKLARFVSSFFIRCRFITLVNLLADKEVFPEYLTTRDNPEEIAASVGRWLENPLERASVVTELDKICEQVARPGAAERAAEFILGELQNPAVRRAA